MHSHVMHAFETGLNQPLNSAIREIEEYVESGLVQHNTMTYDIRTLPTIENMSLFKDKDKGFRFVLIYLNEYLKKNQIDVSGTPEGAYIRVLRNWLSHADKPGDIWSEFRAERGFDRIAQDIMALWLHVGEQTCAVGRSVG